MDIDLINQNMVNGDLAKIKKQPVNPGRASDEDKALKDACAGFEAIFINTMLKNMRNSLPGNALFKESNGMNIYKSMQDQYLSDHLSQGENAVGIKEFLYNQLQNTLNKKM